MSGLLPRGLSALSADPKTGKTLVRFGDDYLTMDELFALDFKGGKGGKSDKDREGKGEGGAGYAKKRVGDIDFNMKGELRKSRVPGGPKKVGSKLSALESKRMNKGGIVRGCGAAKRGKTRGKML